MLSSPESNRFASACKINMTPPQPVGAPALSQLSCDPSSTKHAGQHQTEVEPHSFAAGQLVVVAFQVSRFLLGGASENIGWTTFENGKPVGDTRGLLPGTTKYATPPGQYDRVSNATVAYNARDGVWMISFIAVKMGLPATVTSSAVLVSLSADGVHWGLPVTVAQGAFLDKSWIVCDNSSSSKFYGNCYAEWDDVYAPFLVEMSTSRQHGSAGSWSPPLPTRNFARGAGGEPLVQPDGTVIVPMDSLSVLGIGETVLAFTSVDGGASWGDALPVAPVLHHHVAGNLREVPLLSAGIDPSGQVYVIWSDCSPEVAAGRGCSANDLVMKTSTDGVHWLPEGGAKVITPVGSGADYFIPSLGVDSSSPSGHLGLVYYYYPQANCTEATCNLDADFISSSDGGATWSAPLQLVGPMKVSWLPLTIDPPIISVNGHMVGDYISVPFSGGEAFPMFAAATPPLQIPGGNAVKPVLQEAVFTVSTGLKVA